MKFVISPPPKNLAVTLGLLACMGPLVACEGGRLEPLQSVRVGLLVPQTGALADNGPDWTRAATLAAEQINSAGGLFDGREIFLDVRDSETNGAVAETVARSLIDDGAAVIVGPTTSGAVLGSRDAVASSEVPQLSCCATDPSITSTQDNREGWFFRTTPNDTYQARAIAYVATKGYAGRHPDFVGEGDGVTVAACPEMIIAYQDNDYARALANEIELNYFDQLIYDRDGDGNLTPQLDDQGAEVRGRVVHKAAWPDDFAFGQSPQSAAVRDISDPYMADAFAALQAAHDPVVNPRVCVMILGYADDGGAMVTAFARAEADFNTAQGVALDRQLMGPDGLNDPGFLAAADDLSAQVLGFVPTHAANDAYRKFETAFRARFNKAPAAFTAQMFDAVMIAGLAITAAESTDGVEIRDQLFEVSSGGTAFDGKFFGEMAESLLKGDPIDYIGPSGTLDFDDSGDVIGDYALWQVIRNDDNELEIQESDFLPAALFIE